jgi:hypothetical protein
VRTTYSSLPFRVKAGVGRQADHPDARSVQRVKHAGKGRVLHGNRLARQHLAADQQVYGLLAAGRDDHLRRVGRQAHTFGKVPGDSGAQPG